MSTVDSNVVVVDSDHGDADHNHHDPNLAHHFDTPEQQAQTGKLGMWVFLGTEILMFGGLFCAYSVYRHNHPEVFEYAHQYLNKTLGAVNTLVLITSSLTMAWGVRAAQLGKTKLLLGLLALTIIGGAGFMVIKTVEYHSKWVEDIFFGAKDTDHPNLFADGAAETKNKAKLEGLEEEVLKVKESSKPANPVLTSVTPEPTDPNFGGPDQAKIVPPNITPAGLVAAEHPTSAEGPLTYEKLAPLQRQRVYTFFAIYFCMTGLHGIHVLVGMGLIFWIMFRAGTVRQRAWALPFGVVVLGWLLLAIGFIIEHKPTMVVAGVILLAGLFWIPPRMRSARKVPDHDGEFGPAYFTPVDLVGLYWHLVDLIWIFLFPLLYLIH
jgi:cytochrome c oxidase subunit 3